MHCCASFWLVGWQLFHFFFTPKHYCLCDGIWLELSKLPNAAPQELLTKHSSSSNRNVGSVLSCYWLRITYWSFVMQASCKIPKKNDMSYQRDELECQVTSLLLYSTWWIGSENAERTINHHTPALQSVLGETKHPIRHVCVSAIVELVIPNHAVVRVCCIITSVGHVTS